MTINLRFFHVTDASFALKKILIFDNLILYFVIIKLLDGKA